MKATLSSLMLLLVLLAAAGRTDLQAQAQRGGGRPTVAGQAGHGYEIDWDQTIDNAAKVVSSLGILVAGAWAYLKFFRGRTFVPRLETALSAMVLREGSRRYLLARLVLKNVGLSRVDIHQKGTALRVAGHGGGEAPKVAEAVEWKKLRSFSVFERHAWIESGETIKEEIMIGLPSAAAGFMALRLELRLVGSLHAIDPELGPEPARYTWRESCIVQIHEPPKEGPQDKT